MEFELELLCDATLRLSVISADVANYCDHVEHNEAADIAVVRQAGERLRGVGLELAWAAEKDPVELYAARLTEIEVRNVLSHPDSFDGAAAARAARTWRGLQLVQVRHDREYHPDVIGLSKWEQLHHYALHLVKLAGTTAKVATGDADADAWLSRRVPDMLLFGIKLATVSGQRLLDEPVQARSPTAARPIAS
jgi:hypothetical protein